MTARERIGFIGTGVMGGPMAAHLLEAGYEVTVHSRTRSKAEALLGAGARRAADPASAARAAEIVITMLGFPSEVESVYLGDGGIVSAAENGSLLIDMSTSKPELAERIAAAAEQRGLLALDAPVSGGDIGARNATLTIMAGGDEAAFERARPIFDVLGSTAVLQGGPGAGQHTKMANQIAIGASMLMACESMAYARGVGLDPARVLQSIGAGSAGSWSMANLAPRMLGGDFAPGFYVKHFLKDLRIALDAAVEAGLVLPGLELAERLYEHLEAAGGSDMGTQALWLLYGTAAERSDAGIDPASSVSNARP
jgi:3-hydroxyisobutyrate dehydrogenase